MNTRHFVLVHGACHGAWCWYKMVTLLKSVGHKVTTLDMAASGIHPKQVHQLNSLADYYEPLIEFLKSLPQEERYHQRLDSILDNKIMFDDSPKDKPNGTMSFGPQFVATKLYQLSPPEDLSLAMSLIRPFCSFGDQELLQEKTRVTKDNYGTVAKVYIVCQQDNVLKHDFQLSMIERNPTNDVNVIVDADHMPMFSKPKELFAYLQEIAETYY
ncbi:unnamed protein product [Trifolium pratense]|uniref:Uncharacterized protein n=1 Tax=Trifolium pratense TaxID=57577 RepID=A0ACB0JQH1_TRIPR|nr:unnamed protein product [Trifolium pratense]